VFETPLSFGLKSGTTSVISCGGAKVLSSMVFSGTNSFTSALGLALLLDCGRRRLEPGLLATTYPCASFR